MTATGVTANQIVLDIGSAAGVECQVAGWNLAYADDGGERIYTACPGGVIQVPNADGSVATLTLDLIHDWSATGPSWQLAQLAPAAGVSFTLNADTDKPEQARTYTGTVTLPRIPEDWVARQVQRSTLTLPVTVITGPTRYVPAAAGDELAAE